MRLCCQLLLAGLLFATGGAAPADPLAGLWVAQGSERPAVSGTIEIRQTGNHWTASAGSKSAPGRLVNAGLQFTFPGGLGELRSALPGKLGASAFWIQPGGHINTNEYATRVIFTRESGRVWSGTLTPYVPRFQLYIQIARQTDGSLTGFLRDPIGTAGQVADYTGIDVSGPTFTLHGRGGDRHGVLDNDANSFTLSLDNEAPLRFERTARDQAAGFLPRLPGSPTAPQKPAQAADGWPVAKPADVAIEPSQVASLTAQIAALLPTSAHSPAIQSVLVARSGKLVFEEYFFGFNRATPHDVRSAGKSLDSAIFGIAARANPSLRPEDTVARWLPYRAYANPDARKQRITIADLLDMTSGLDCDDNDDASPGNEDRMQSQTAQRDWYKYVLDLKLLRAPGEKGAYCSAGLNLVGGVVANATHRWTPQLFEAGFAQPLQFGEYHLQLTPHREMYLGGGSYFLPRDFLKLGQLFLDRGRWHGRQVLSPAWVTSSTSPHSGLVEPNDYGYAWHVTHYTAGGKNFQAFEAQGNGGQFLTVVPALHLVIQIMAANYGDYRTWSKFHEMVTLPVIAACR